MAPGPLRVLGRHAMTGLKVLAWLSMLARLRVLADPCALAHPDCAGPEHAAQLADARQVGAVT